MSEQIVKTEQPLTEQPARKPFAPGLSPFKLILIFAVCSFIGVMVETLWCFIITGHFESRAGLLYGPFNVVYGFGGVLMTIALYWLRNRQWYFVFIAGFVLGALFEFLCSVVQENMFGTVSWDYEETPLNIGGRTNAMYAFFWGILGLLWIKLLFPFFSKWIEKIPRKIGITVTVLIAVFFVFNMTISTLASMRMTARHQGIPPQNAVDTFLDTYYPDARMDEVYTHTIYVNEDGTKTDLSKETLEGFAPQYGNKSTAQATTTTTGQ